MVREWESESMRKRVSGRDPATPYEVAAMYHYHDRYAAQDGGVIEFYASLTAEERQFIARMVDAILEARSPS
jgi:hypothetical protein